MNVLGVFAHPDDEVLGAGGTLAKHAASGDKTFFATMTDCGRWDEFERAMNTLGAASGPLGGWTFKDQEFDLYPIKELVTGVEGVAERCDPDIIYTHHPGDLNLDHALTARAVLTAFRPKPGEKPRTILACEVLSSTEWTFPQQFQPNWFESLSGEHWGCLEKKIDALNCYPTEVQPAPHPRSEDGIMNLARYRGQQCGVTYAEAFQLLRRGPA